jgi:2-amino-4-hydroxy-6-hydroxymethyldihydropteridine diphosphokinase
LSARRRTPESTVVLSLGSNLGRREEHLLAGVSTLRSAGALTLEALSSLYETSPVGIATDNAFINAVLVARTDRSPAELLAVCRGAERSAGREASGPSRDRTLDIDIIFYGDLTIEEPGLVVPHPRYHERLFVLVPLAEVRPEYRVPPSGKTVAETLRRCGGDAWVRKVSGRLWIR